MRTPAAAGIVVRASSGSGADPVLVIADRYARSGADHQRGRDQIAGRALPESAGSFTVYGMVIAGMKPGMSSCLTSTSLVSGLTTRICPVS